MAGFGVMADSTKSAAGGGDTVGEGCGEKEGGGVEGSGDVGGGNVGSIIMRGKVLLICPLVATVIWYVPGGRLGGRKIVPNDTLSYEYVLKLAVPPGPTIWTWLFRRAKPRPYI